MPLMQKCCHAPIGFPSCVTMTFLELRVQQSPTGFCMALSNNNHNFFPEFAEEMHPSRPGWESWSKGQPTPTRLFCLYQWFMDRFNFLSYTTYFADIDPTLFPQHKNCFWKILMVLLSCYFY